MIKVLNLYAGIGGNRKLWEDVEVTAVEYNEEIAKIYQDFFPNDKVVVGDAHKYLLEHYKEFDFIWSSPPCPSHSAVRYLGAKNGDYEPVISLVFQSVQFCSKVVITGKVCSPAFLKLEYPFHEFPVAAYYYFIVVIIEIIGLLAVRMMIREHVYIVRAYCNEAVSCIQFPDKAFKIEIPQIALDYDAVILIYSPEIAAEHGKSLYVFSGIHPELAVKKIRLFEEFFHADIQLDRRLYERGIKDLFRLCGEHHEITLSSS